MNTFYFNTGCHMGSKIHLFKDHVWRGGTEQIPFDADAPDGSELLFLCDDPALPEGEDSSIIVREIFNTSMLSKYAYMRLPYNHNQ